MPLPLLLAVPFVYAASAGAGTTISTTVATLIGLGAGTGGVAVGAGSWWAFGFFSKRKAQPTQSHQDSLAAQNRMTQERIDSANQALESLAAEATALKLEVREAATATTVSVDHLKQLSERISETNERLMAAVENARESSRTLTDSLPALREVSQSSHLKGIAAVTMLGELNELLTLKVDTLIQTARDIGALQHTVDEQTTVITRLESEVEALTLDNEDKSRVIAENREELLQVRDLLARRNEKCRFFKQQLERQSTLPAPVPTVAQLS